MSAFSSLQLAPHGLNPSLSPAHTETEARHESDERPGPRPPARTLDFGDRVARDLDEHGVDIRDADAVEEHTRFGDLEAPCANRRCRPMALAGLSRDPPRPLRFARQVRDRHQHDSLVCYVTKVTIPRDTVVRNNPDGRAVRQAQDPDPVVLADPRLTWRRGPHRRFAARFAAADSDSPDCAPPHRRRAVRERRERRPLPYQHRRTRAPTQGPYNALYVHLPTARARIFAVVVALLAPSLVYAAEPINADVVQHPLRHGEGRREPLDAQADAFDVVREQDADIIGLQEALDSQIREIVDAVPGLRRRRRRTRRCEGGW